MKKFVPLWLVLTLLPLSAFAQKGLVVYKDAPWDGDQFATSTLYKEIERFPTVHNITPMTGNKLRVNSVLVMKDLVFPTPDSLAEIQTEAQVKSVETVIADWTATMKRFPTSAKYLKPRITQLQTELAQFHAGKVKSDGVWLTKEALLAKQKKAEEEKQKRLAKLEAEARQQGMLVEEWAGLDEAGRKRAREAKLRAEEAQMRADEERRIKEAIEAQEKLAEARAKMKPFERLSTDTWVTPPGLKEDQVKDYEDTLKLVKEQLSKGHDDLGFGKEAQRMVLKTPERIYVFAPGELSPEVQVVKAEENEKEKEKPSELTLESTGKKDVIEVVSKDSSEKVLSSSIVLTTVAAMDLEKLTQGMSHLIELCGGKRELEKTAQKQE